MPFSLRRRACPRDELQSSESKGLRAAKRSAIRNDLGVGSTNWIEWLPLAVFPLCALIVSNRLPSWAFMWTLAFAIYAGLKWASWWKIAPSSSADHWAFRRISAGLARNGCQGVLEIGLPYYPDGIVVLVRCDFRECGWRNSAMERSATPAFQSPAPAWMGRNARYHPAPPFRYF